MLSVTAHSTSAADDLGFHGQLALSRMMSSGQRGDYRLIGGHMVRLLLLAYPTERAVPRSTVDVDAGLSALEVAGPLAADPSVAALALGDVRPLKDVLEEGPGRRRVVGVDEHVHSGQHGASVSPASGRDRGSASTS